MRKKRFFRRAIYGHPDQIYVSERSPKRFSSWLSSKSTDRPVTLELGMGTGEHLVAQALANPDRFFLGVEIKPDRIYKAFEKADEFAVRNIVFLQTSVELLPKYSLPIFNEIFVLFPDPWPKKRHAFRRLSSPNFLKSYERMLSDSGKLTIKTDNYPLFEYSIESFQKEFWEIIDSDMNYLTPEAFRTGYEIRYLSQQKPIFFAQAMKSRKQFSIRKTFSRLLHFVLRY